MLPHRPTQPRPPLPTLLVIAGGPSSGKTTRVNNLAARHPGTVLIRTPESIDDAFVANMDWSACDCLVLDEVGEASLAAALPAILRLYADATAHGKKLLMVVQSLDHLDLIRLPDVALPVAVLIPHDERAQNRPRPGPAKLRLVTSS